jgi:hypothetical protein
VFDTTEGTTGGLGWSPEAGEIFARIAADEPPEEVVLAEPEPSGSPSASGEAQEGSADTGGDAEADTGTEAGETGDTGTGETGGAADGGGDKPAKPKPKPSPEVLLDGVCA